MTKADSPSLIEMHIIEKYGLRQAEPILADIRAGKPIPEPYSSDILVQDFQRALIASGGLVNPMEETEPLNIGNDIDTEKDITITSTDLMQEIMEAMTTHPETCNNDWLLYGILAQRRLNFKSVERARRKIQEMAREKLFEGHKEYAKYLASEQIARLRKKLAEKFKDWSLDKAHTPAEKDGIAEGELRK